MAATSLRCGGCGAPAPPIQEAPYPFRCARAVAGDDVDHLMERALDPRGIAFPSGVEASPFARYRVLFHAYHTARAGGLSDPDYLDIVTGLDDRVVAAQGRGFVVTPLSRAEGIERALGLRAGLWVKNDTVNVGESHKSRHLMGILIWLAVIDRLGLAPAGGPAPLAIASCGNAALAAGVVAHAVGRKLRTFIPPDADRVVIDRLARLGAEEVFCPRDPAIPGDPCVHAFRRAVAEGATPFACEGLDQGLTIDGGATLGAEIAAEAPPLDRVFLQVGGGALAAAVIQGFEDAHALGRIARLPRFCAVQPRAVSPLRRAWDRVATRILGRAGAPSDGPDHLRAERIRGLDRAVIEDELRHAATHRADFMWPWEGEPHSIARAIMDDETYDWLAVVRGMLVTGGYPIAAEEESLARANALAREATGVGVGPSGSAGLAGLMQALAAEPALADERVAVIFSGVRG